MKIPLNKTEVIDKKEFVARFYVNKADEKPFNALFVESIIGHYKTKLKNAARLYFVVEGNGSFTIDGVREEANKYDFFLIQDVQIYEYSGKMKLIEVNVPATGSSNQERLDN